MIDDNFSIPAVSRYTPEELVGIYKSLIERGNSNGVVWLEGKYVQRPNQNSQWDTVYDYLFGVDSKTCITLKIKKNDRAKLKSNSLVQVGGIIELNSYDNGSIQILLNVTRFEVVQDHYISDQDLKRIEIRNYKSKKGFKNVDAILEERLFKGENPRVALIFATSSITWEDFKAGANAACANIDFQELRHSFAKGNELASFLALQDKEGYDVIALIRGGGSGIEALDDIQVLQTVADMNTPVICAIGHVGEELFIKSIADKVAPTPNGLGQYFSEMVERVMEKRNNSRAVLVEEVKKQFQQQLDDSNKKNEEFLKQIQSLTELSQEQTNKFNNNNGRIYSKLKEEQEKNKELEKQLADAKTEVSDSFYILIIGAIIGYIIARYI